MKKFWMGADPGGKGNFGLAFLDTTGKWLRCATVSSVDEAVELITSTGIPLGLGIDAPMWWSSCEGAGRKVDESIREKYGIHPGTVQSANSLRGAALVGGAMLAFRIRQKFPDTRITETHPKALLCALKIDEASFAKRFGISLIGKMNISGMPRSAQFAQGRVSRGAGCPTWPCNAITLNRTR